MNTVSRGNPIPWWKRWLSYLKEIHLETVTSNQGSELSVVLSEGRLALMADNAIYSYDDLYINFTVTLQKIDRDWSTNDRVLILGTGLGSIIHIFEKEMGVNPQFTAVEYDETVIYLASKYSFPRFKSPIDIHLADAYQFLLSTKTQYDLICMDVFIDDRVPNHFESISFSQLLKDKLSPTGICLYNRLYQYTRDIKVTDQFEKDNFSKVFSDYGFVEVEGNRVYISDKSLLIE
jgi:spermidine synthase